MLISLRRSACTLAIMILFTALISSLMIQGGPSDPDIRHFEMSTRSTSTEPFPLDLDLPDIDPEYIVICPRNFSEETRPLAVHRTLMGLPTRIYCIEDIDMNSTGRDLEERIHTFLKDMKREYPSFQWLLIMGDSEFLHPRQLWHNANARLQPFGDYYHSDVYFAGLGSNWDDDGDMKYGEVYFNGTVEADTDWDLYVGRIPASTEEHVTNYVSKLLRYEKDPPIGTWMKRFHNWGSLMEPPNEEEGVHTYYEHRSNAYKVCQRVNDRLPEHIVLQELYDYPQMEGGNYTMYDGKDTLHRGSMLLQFDQGSSMLNFVGQARYLAYALNDYGPPYGDGTTWTWNEPLTYRDHEIFTNGDMMPFMYASTCDTAKFFQTGYWEDKSLETWLTSESGGIIGLISSTNVSARGEEMNRSWGNWYLDEEFWDLFLNSGETRPGRALYLLKGSYEDEWYSPTMQIKETIMGMVYAYILLGEPYIDIYTDKAERFPSDLTDRIAIYQGNHSFRFRITDRNGEGVSNALMTVSSHSTYERFSSDGNGWVEGTIDPLGDLDLNITISAHNMIMGSYEVQVKSEIADILIEEDTLSISPSTIEHGDMVNVTFSILNHGGLTALDVCSRVETSIDDGGNWTLKERKDLGDIGEGSTIDIHHEFKIRAGHTLMRFTMETASMEIDLMNNALEIEFDISGPEFIFEAGTGAVRPGSISRPGDPLTIDFDIFNQGPASGTLTLQLYIGDPDVDGEPIIGPLDIGRVVSNSWANGSFSIAAPMSTAFIYIVMDPMNEYPIEMVDGPVKTLIEINEEPRSIEKLTIVMLEDSGPGRVRIDTKMNDPDNSTSDIRYTVQDTVNLTFEIRVDGDGTYIYAEPLEDWWGNETVTVKVSDGLGSVDVDLMVSVMPINDPPIVLDTIDGKIRLTLLEDSQFSFIISVIDKEGHNISFHADGAPFEIDGSNGRLTWTPGQGDVGTSTWTVLVRDSEGGEITFDIIMDVTEMNDPPNASLIEDITLEPDSSDNIVLSIYDEEGGEITIIPSHSFITLIEDRTLEVQWDERYIGDTDVTIEISDGVNTIYLVFRVTMLSTGDDVIDVNEFEYEPILIAVGIAIAMIAILFIMFMAVRRSPSSALVDDEMDDANAIYDEDME